MTSGKSIYSTSPVNVTTMHSEFSTKIHIQEINPLKEQFISYHVAVLPVISLQFLPSSCKNNGFSRFSEKQY